nr:hypothetical protein [uncultured Desulfobulbus sp.]
MNITKRPEAIERALLKLHPQLLQTERDIAGRFIELDVEVKRLKATIEFLNNRLYEEEVTSKSMAGAVKEYRYDAEQYWFTVFEISESIEPGFFSSGDVSQVPKIVRETISRLQIDKAQIKQVAERLSDENTVLVNRVSELEKRLEDIDDWEKIPSPGLELESNLAHDLMRDQLADFALKIIQGQVGIVHREA